MMIKHPNLVSTNPSMPARIPCRHLATTSPYNMSLAPSAVFNAVSMPVKACEGSAGSQNIEIRRYGTICTAEFLREMVCVLAFGPKYRA
jgi:hypothetical protein